MTACNCPACFGERARAAMDGLARLWHTLPSCVRTSVAAALCVVTFVLTLFVSFMVFTLVGTIAYTVWDALQYVFLALFTHLALEHENVVNVLIPALAGTPAACTCDATTTENARLGLLLAQFSTTESLYWVTRDAVKGSLNVTPSNAYIWIYATSVGLFIFFWAWALQVYYITGSQVDSFSRWMQTTKEELNSGLADVSSELSGGLERVSSSVRHAKKSILKGVNRRIDDALDDHESIDELVQETHQEVLAIRSDTLRERDAASDNIITSSKAPTHTIADDLVMAQCASSSSSSGKNYIGTCGRCRQSRALEDGLCQACMRLPLCPDCGQVRVKHAPRFCLTCSKRPEERPREGVET